jgi:hypothetical protein
VQGVEGETGVTVLHVISPHISLAASRMDFAMLRGWLLGAISTNPVLYPYLLSGCPLPKNAKAEKILIVLNKLSIN